MNIGNLDVYGVIYKIRNIQNNKIYIGQTTQIKGFLGRYDYYGNGIERVFNYYKAKERYGEYRNEHLLNSIKKYGFENFEIITMFDIAFSQTELNIKEAVWIDYYKSNSNQYGYNNRKGGNNSEFALESKRKKSRKIMCLNDKKVYLSTCEASDFYNISISSINSCCKGNSEYCRKNGKRYVFRNITDCEDITDDEISKLLSKINTIGINSKHHSAKKVYCITIDKVFKTINEAEKHYKVINKAISQHLRGNTNYVTINNQRTVWCYYDNYLKMSKKQVVELIYKSTSKYKKELLSKSHIGKMTHSNSPNARKIICINTNEVFDCIRDAIEKYNCNGIWSCLKGKTKTSGKHPQTGEKLMWKYY